MKSNQRVALTKRLLQEALQRLMKRKPLDKISVSELCDEAQINRATFYRHYNVPRDVLVEMQLQFTERVHTALDMNTLVNTPYRYVEQLCACLYEHSELVKLFIRNNSEEDMISLFDEFFLMLLKEDDSIIKKRTLDQSEQKLVSAYMAGGGYYMLRRWLLDGIDKTPQQIASLVLSFADSEIL